MKNTKYTRFAAAAAMYIAFAVYLYRYYFEGFSALRLQDLFIPSICLASLGCYVLSRRWVAGFAESFFAGAVYGFGPFTLGLAKFHPTSGLLAASIPWLFCPAVFCPKNRRRWLRVPFSILPFLAIVLFFQVSARFHLYPIPIKLKLHSADLVGLLAPLVAAMHRMTLVGFYHIPVAAMILGFSMLLIARRYGIMIIFAIATILAFCDSFFDVSPVIWLSISTLCCSIFVGAGMQGLICAGFADRKWILFTAIVMGIFAIVTLLLATRYFSVFAGLGEGTARLFTETAQMYILGAIAVAILFFIARAKLRMHPLRQILLCGTMALDIFLGARFIVDKIF